MNIVLILVLLTLGESWGLMESEDMKIQLARLQQQVNGDYQVLTRKVDELSSGKLCINHMAFRHQVTLCKVDMNAYGLFKIT